MLRDHRPCFEHGDKQSRRSRPIFLQIDVDIPTKHQGGDRDGEEDKHRNKGHDFLAHGISHMSHLFHQWPARTSEPLPKLRLRKDCRGELTVIMVWYHRP